MKFLYSLTGANHPVIKEFTIDKDSNIRAGELVIKNPVGGFGASQMGTIVGISAEDHTGEKDILNERNNGDKLRIDITRGGVYEVDALNVVATAESAMNTLVTMWSYLNSSLVGGKLVLKEKGEDSVNTDEIGAIRTIEGDTITNQKCIFTLSEGGEICEGDVYALIIPVGYNGSVAKDRKTFAPSGEFANCAKVIRENTDACKMEIVFGNKLFD